MNSFRVLCGTDRLGRTFSETQGGEVFIYARDTVVATEQRELKSDCEIFFGIKMELDGCKAMNLIL